MNTDISSPVTGAAVTGLTSPTYTYSESTAPNANSRSYAVTAIGGTQTGVDTQSLASRPWTITFGRPGTIRQQNAVDSSGVLRNVPFNTYTIVGRKGLTPLTDQASRTSIMRTEIPVPAGADVYDQANLKAMISSYFGVCYAGASGIYGMLTSGEL